MAQGTIKKSSRQTPTGGAKAKHQAKKPAGRVAKPKKANKTSIDKIQRKFTSGLAAKTEQLLGERAGHLELIGKGKKADKSDKGKNKGGTRKFG